MEIEKRGVAELTQDPRNARSHDGKNIEAIKRSLQEFGQQKPIVVNTSGEVVAGNGTLAAAVDLGWENIAVVETDLVGSSAAAYAIADNRTAELAAWDDDALAETLEALRNDEGFDELVAGFSEQEIEVLISGVVIDLGIDEEENNFAQGRQFGAEGSTVFEATLPCDKDSLVEAKSDLIMLCEKYDIEYSVRKA